MRHHAECVHVMSLQLIFSLPVADVMDTNCTVRLYGMGESEILERKLTNCVPISGNLWAKLKLVAESMSH